jgi:hypothetical protein
MLVMVFTDSSILFVKFISQLVILLNNLLSNTSDHNPIFITINGNIKTKTAATKPIDNTMARRIRWDKIDKEEKSKSSNKSQE